MRRRLLAVAQRVATDVYSAFPNRRVTDFTTNWVRRHFRRVKAQLKHYTSFERQLVPEVQRQVQSRFGAKLLVRAIRPITQFRTAAQRITPIQYKTLPVLPNDPIGLPLRTIVRLQRRGQTLHSVRRKFGALLGAEKRTVSFSVSHDFRQRARRVLRLRKRLKLRRRSLFGVPHR